MAAQLCRNWSWHLMRFNYECSIVWNEMGREGRGGIWKDVALLLTYCMLYLWHPTSPWRVTVAIERCFWTECWECRIWGSHGRVYEEFCLLGYNALYSVEIQPTLRSSISPPSSGSFHICSTIFLAWIIIWAWKCRLVSPTRRLIFWKTKGR
jgi:hypothetical protein